MAARKPAWKATGLNFGNITYRWEGTGKNKRAITIGATTICTWEVMPWADFLEKVLEIQDLYIEPFSVSIETDYGYGGEEEHSIALYGTRYATEAEVQTILEYEQYQRDIVKKEKERRENEERTELKRLLKKYGEELTS